MVSGAKLRVKIVQLLQAFLVLVHLARTKLEDARIAALLAAEREVIPLPACRQAATFDIVALPFRLFAMFLASLS